jgi:hypothetical protein
MSRDNGKKTLTFPTRLKLWDITAGEEHAGLDNE